MTEANGVPDGTNGTNGTHTPVEATCPKTPPRPTHTTLALTEYTANTSPVSSRSKERAPTIVPEHLLLPNGHPDVSHLLTVPWPRVLPRVFCSTALLDCSEMRR